MKRINKSFTLIEMMMVLGIIAILFGIGTAVFTVATGKSEIASAKSQIAQLTAAIEMYYDRWGQYPVPSGDEIDDVNDAFNFAEWLSKVSPREPLFQNPDTSPGSKDTIYRKMFLNFNGYDISNPEYAHVDLDENANSIIYDPWGQPYGYSYDATTKSFIVYSVGPDIELESGDGMSAEFISPEWVFSKSGSPIPDPEGQGIISSHLK